MCKKWIFRIGWGEILNVIFGIIEVRDWIFFRYSIVLKIQYWNFSVEHFCYSILLNFGIFQYSRYFGNAENISNTVQYYWILKMFNTEISILLNIENVQYRNFNTIEYWKCSIPNFQYYWIPKKIPIPNFNNTKNYFQYFSPP